MRNNGKKIDITCECGSQSHTMSGNNSWTTIKRATKTEPAVKVLKQRFLCGGCGGFNWRHLDGSVIKNEYSDYEIKKLVKLTKDKLAQKELRNNNGGCLDEPIPNG